MNISRHTSLTRIVPILTTVLLVLCCLPLWVGSEQYSLTTKAYQATYQDTSTANFISTQWDYSGNYHLYKEFPLVGDGESIYNCYQFSFAGEYYGDKALVWAVEIYDSSGNTRLYTTGAQYYDTGQVVAVGLPSVSPNDYSQHNDIVYRCHIWVKRKDGGTVDRTSMYASNWTWYLNRSVDVEDNTLPDDWFVDTTATVVNPVESYTTVIGTQIPWDDIEHQMDLPIAVENAVLYIYDLVSQILVMRYLTFMIVFGLSCALICWILH